MVAAQPSRFIAEMALDKTTAREDPRGRPAGQSPAQALVAGDVDNGAFTLEESTDGRAISATWSGSFADQACGKEIRGTWTDTATRIERAFVLRKQPGWQ
jgi:hypothetical protein